MGRTTGHRIKPVKRLSLPRVVFVIVPVRDEPVPRDAKSSYVHKWQGAHCLRQCRDHGTWGGVEEFFAPSGNAMREWLHSRAVDGCTQWVIAPSAPDLLTLSEWWSYAERKGAVHGDSADGAQERAKTGGGDHSIRITRLCASERCGIIEYVERGIRWRYVSASNYWSDGGLVAPVHHAGASDREGIERCAMDERDVRGIDGPRAVLSRFRGLCVWWSRVACAPLGCTAGQLAVQCLRSHPDCSQLVTHSCADTHRLERAAAHGGRMSTWYTGVIVHGDDTGAAGLVPGRAEGRVRPRGPITALDVSSMYPYLLRDMRFPVKRTALRSKCAPSELVALANDIGVIARARIRTNRAEYPYRRKDDVIYPCGEFTTALAGPDILALAEHGEIVHVHEVAEYQLGRPFRACMDKLLAERARATADTDADAKALSKLVANTLGGRLAMRAGKWARDSWEDMPRAWGEWYRTSARTGLMTKFRHVAGLAWRWDAGAEPTAPYTAAWCYLTAYGRQHMARLRRLCPQASVVAQACDGLFCLPDAVAALRAAGELSGVGPGSLRVEETAQSARFWGPNHYKWDDEFVLAGYRSHQWDATTQRVWHLTTAPLWSRPDRSAPSAVVETGCWSELPQPDCGGYLDPFGWVEPFVLKMAQPEE